MKLAMVKLVKEGANRFMRYLFAVVNYFCLSYKKLVIMNLKPWSRLADFGRLAGGGWELGQFIKKEKFLIEIILQIRLTEVLKPCKNIC